MGLGKGGRLIFPGFAAAARKVRQLKLAPVVGKRSGVQFCTRKIWERKGWRLVDILDGEHTYMLLVCLS